MSDEKWSALDMLRMSESVTVPTQTVLYIASRVESLQRDLRWAEEARDALAALLVEHGMPADEASRRIGHDIEGARVEAGRARLESVAKWRKGDGT